MASSDSIWLLPPTTQTVTAPHKCPLTDHTIICHLSALQNLPGNGPDLWRGMGAGPCGCPALQCLLLQTSCIRDHRTPHPARSIGTCCYLYIMVSEAAALSGCTIQTGAKQSVQWLRQCLHEWTNRVRGDHFCNHGAMEAPYIRIHA